MAKSRPPFDDPEREATVERLFQIGRDAWPKSKLERVTFVERLAKSAPTQETLSALHAADFFLACACAERDADALFAFEALLESVPVRLPTRGAASESTTKEVRQVVREKLFVVGKIAEYRGRSPLRAWLKTVVARIAVDLARKTAREDAADDDVLGRLPSPANDPELAHLKDRYKTEFRTALLEAIGALSARERTLLRQHHIDALTMDELSALHGVHRVTVVRWVTSARERLAAETRRRLLQQFGVGASELASIMRLMTTNIDLSLRLALDRSRSTSR